MSRMDQQFSLFVQDTSDAAADLVAGLLHGKLAAIADDVSEYYHTRPGLEEKVANALQDIAAQQHVAVDPQAEADRTIHCLEHELGVDPQLVLPVLHVHMLYERGMRLFFHVATEQFNPEYRGNFEYMSIRRELERACNEMLSDVGGIGQAQAAQMIRNFEAATKELCREHMSEHGIAREAVSR